MAQPTQVQVVGAVSAQPSAPSLFTATLQEYLSLAVQATYGAMKGGVISVNAPSTPFPLPFEGILRGRLFAMRLDSGATMEVRVTTGLGVAVLPVSDELVIHSPNPGDEITALSFLGTGDVRYLLAGDVS